MISPEEARRRAELWARALLAEDWSARMLRDAYGDQDTALAMLTAAELHASWLLDVRAQSRPLPPPPRQLRPGRPPAPRPAAVPRRTPVTAPRPAPPGWTYLGSCDGGGGAWIAPLGTPWPPPGDLPGDGDDAGEPPEVHDAVITAAWQGRHAGARRPDPPGGAR